MMDEKQIAEMMHRWERTPHGFGREPGLTDVTALIAAMRAPWSSNPWVWAISFKRMTT